MTKVRLYGWCTATLHLRHFVKRTVGPCVLKKVGRWSAWQTTTHAGSAHVFKPSLQAKFYQVFKRHFCRQRLQCLMVKANMVKAYCISDVFRNALIRTCVFCCNNSKFSTAFLLVFKTVHRDSSRRGEQRTVFHVCAVVCLDLCRSGQHARYRQILSSTSRVVPVEWATLHVNNPH